MAIDPSTILESLAAAGAYLWGLNQVKQGFYASDIQETLGDAHAVQRNLFYAIRNVESGFSELEHRASLASTEMQEKFGPEVPYLDNQECRKIFIEASEFYGKHWKAPLTRVFIADTQRADFDGALKQVCVGGKILGELLGIEYQPSYPGTDNAHPSYLGTDESMS